MCASQKTPSVPGFRSKGVLIWRSSLAAQPPRELARTLKAAAEVRFYSPPACTGMHAGRPCMVPAVPRKTACSTH